MCPRHFHMVQARIPRVNTTSSPSAHQSSHSASANSIYSDRIPFPLVLLCGQWPSVPWHFFFKSKYTVTVFRHVRRGCQFSLWMVVRHHVVAWIWTQDLQRSSQCSEQLTHLSSLTNVFLASGNSARIMSQNMEFKEWGPVERHWMCCKGISQA